MNSDFFISESFANVCHDLENFLLRSFFNLIVNFFQWDIYWYKISFVRKE